MLGRTVTLVVKDFRQFLRDRVLIIFILGGPTLQLVLLGQATGADITRLPAAVLDEDQTSASRALTVALDNLRQLEITNRLDDIDEAGPFLDRGEISLAVLIPPGFAEALGSPQERVSVQVLVDGSNILGALTAVGAAEGAISHFAQDSVIERRELLGGGNPSGPMLDLRPIGRFNPDLIHNHYILSAQLSLIVHVVTLLTASVGIVREREMGTLEQLMVTPLTRIELIVGKATLPMLVAFVDFVAMLAIVVWVFGVPVRGSVASLLAVTLLFIVAQLTWGLVISAVSATQQQAILLIFMIAILNVAFSGYLAAVENMPLPMQLASNFFPIRHYLIMLRGIMLKGASLASLQPQLIALTGLGIASLAISVRSFRKQLE